MSDSVVRIRKAYVAKIKELAPKGSFNDKMKLLLEMVDAFQDGETVYLAEGKVFKDLADARGEAIVGSVRRQDVPSMPKVAIILGDDPGGV